jgi:hypothetical protein
MVAEDDRDPASIVSKPEVYAHNALRSVLALTRFGIAKP